MKKIIIIVLLLTFSNCQVNDPNNEGNQYSDSKKFLQFENGNYWIYKIFNRTWDGRESTSIVKSVFSGVETIDNIRYYRLKNINTQNDSSYIFYRLDSDSGYLYKYDKTTNSEYIETILSSTPGKYQINYENYPNKYTGVSITEETFDRFGENIKILKHVVADLETSRTYKYSDKHGYIDYYFHYLTVEKKRTLLGCFINSIAYGDTTFTSINLNEKYLILYPLEEGNWWKFSYEEKTNDAIIKSSVYHRIVEKDTLINDLRYFKLVTNIEDSSYVKSEYERVDSVSALIYRFDFVLNEEYLVDKLNVQDFTGWYDTYRFNNDGVTKNENWIAKPFYYQKLTYGNNPDCISEKFIYSLLPNIGLAELIVHECEKNIYINLLDYHIVE